VCSSQLQQQVDRAQAAVDAVAFTASTCKDTVTAAAAAVAALQSKQTKLTEQRNMVRGTLLIEPLYSKVHAVCLHECGTEVPVQPLSVYASEYFVLESCIVVDANS
jgi:hypothetical protein